MPTYKQVSDMVYSPDGKTLALGDEAGKVSFLDVASRKIAGSSIQAFTSDDIFTNLTNLAFSPDGKYLVTNTLAGRPMLWDLSTHKLLHDFKVELFDQNNFEPLTTYGIAYSGDGRLIAFGDDKGQIVLWDTQKNAIAKRLTVKDATGVYSVAFSLTVRN